MPKYYEQLSPIQLQNVNTAYHHLLNDEEKEIIKNMYARGFKVTEIAIRLDEVYPAVIKQYLQSEGIEVHEKSNFIQFSSNTEDTKNNKAYVEYTFSYGKVRRYVWVLSRELNVPISTIKNYVVHHFNYLEEGTKLNDDIMNLFICFDAKMHREIHILEIKSLEKLAIFLCKNIKKRKAKAKTLQEIKALKEYYRLAKKLLRIQKKRMEQGALAI